jgi:hypothetical protein
MRRRNFFTTACAALVSPVVALFGKEKAAAEALPNFQNCSRDYIKRLQSHAAFRCAQARAAESNLESLDPRPIAVDYSILSMDGVEGNEWCDGHHPTPLFVLEYDGGPDVPGALRVDHWVWAPPKLDQGSGSIGGPVRDTLLELQLSDPYQVCLASMLVQRAYRVGMIPNKDFITAWNQALIAAQRWQHSEKRKEQSGTPPVDFLFDPPLRPMFGRISIVV